MEGMADFVGAVDQGTTSTRFMVFDHEGNEVARHQLEHQQILPRPGWMEHDPVEVWERTRTVIAATLNAAGLSARDLAALGITNSARRRWCGTGAPAFLTRTRSCGRTPGPTGSPRRWTGAAAAR
jgi:glycerol kinase